jgi:hypothetical protein
VVIVVAIVAVVAVVMVAAAVVVREANRIGRNPPGALFDADDAYEWVVDRLPDDVAATLTPDDVRRILDLQLEFLEREASRINGSDGAGEYPVVVGGGEAIEYVVDRAASTGESYLPEQVDAVLETQLAYLRHIGAIGPEATGDDRA